MYNLDVIISVGYRVKSKNGIIFRQWANKILKDYMLKGYAVNQRRLEYLEKTIKLIDIANRIDDRLENNDAFKCTAARGNLSSGFLVVLLQKHYCNMIFILHATNLNLLMI